MRDMNKGNEVQIKVSTPSLRGLRDSLNRVLKLSSKMDKTGITETWVRQFETDIMSTLSESVNTILEKDGQKE